LRNKPIYILTEDLNFFYRINKALNSKKLNFKILGIQDKIPNIPSIILTTFEELDLIKPINDFIDIIPYASEENLEKYIFKILAAYRLGYRDYETLIFSIDPGLNHIGIVVFLDYFYLNSQTILERKNLIKQIKKYEESIQEDNSKELKLIFKFGKSLHEIIRNFINEILNLYEEKRVKIYLIDESHSSKIRVSHKGRKFPKHESSALILAFRRGLEVNSDNYETLLFKHVKQIKDSSSKQFKDGSIKLSEIAEKVINGEISLKKSYYLMNNDFELKQGF
jgi:hypothetical protein